MLVVQYQSAKLRGLRELVSRMDRVGAWVRGCVGGVSQKNEVWQQNGMGLNVLLSNHTL